MKRSMVFVPAILLVLFLLNSFVIKQKEAREKTTKEPINIAFKSADGGQSWQDISHELREINLGERDSKTPNWLKEHNAVKAAGVTIATGQKGIRRSTDNGAHWQWVISEGGVGIAVEQINGGFAAISYNTKTQSRKIHISLDAGKTWQAIDNGLPPSALISSIKQTGKYLIVGHPDGIFRSADMGKTWSSVHAGVKEGFNFLPTWNSPFSQDKKVFRLYSSDNVVYAVAGIAGC